MANVISRPYINVHNKIRIKQTTYNHLYLWRWSGDQLNSDTCRHCNSSPEKFLLKCEFYSGGTTYCPGEKWPGSNLETDRCGTGVYYADCYWNSSNNRDAGVTGDTGAVAVNGATTAQAVGQRAQWGTHVLLGDALGFCKAWSVKWVNGVS